MPLVYLAMSGEYDSLHLGCFNTLEQAKKAVEKSNPTYSAEVICYDTDTGKPVMFIGYDKSWIEGTGWAKQHLWQEPKESA